MDDYKDEIQREKLLKPKLFQYPDWSSPSGVFDYEELENTENMLVLCVRQDVGEEYRDEHTCYVWKGPEFDASEHEESAQMDENAFVQKCMAEYWGADKIASLNIKLVNEDPDAQSEAFEYFFD